MAKRISLLLDIETLGADDAHLFNNNIQKLSPMFVMSVPPNKTYRI